MSKQVKGFVLGAVVGSVAALLFAPKSGRELRHKLTNKVTGVVDEIEEAVNANDATEKPVQEVSESLQQQAEEIARQLRASRSQNDLTPEEAAKMAADDSEEIVVKMDPTTETIPVSEAKDKE